MTRWTFWFILLFFTSSSPWTIPSNQHGLLSHSSSSSGVAEALKLAMPSFRSSRRHESTTKRNSRRVMFLRNNNGNAKSSYARTSFFKRRYRAFDEDSIVGVMEEQTTISSSSSPQTKARQLLEAVVAAGQNNQLPFPTAVSGKPLFYIDPRALVAVPTTKEEDTTTPATTTTTTSTSPQQDSTSSSISSALQSPLFRPSSLAAAVVSKKTRSEESPTAARILQVSHKVQEILENGLPLDQDSHQDYSIGELEPTTTTATKSPLFRPVSFAPHAPTRTASGDYIAYDVEQLRQKVFDEGLPLKRIVLSDDIFKRATMTNDRRSAATSSAAGAATPTTTTATTPTATTATTHSTPTTPKASTSTTAATTSQQSTATQQPSTNDNNRDDDEDWLLETSLLQNHTVLQLMVERFHTGSTPGHRAPNDTARLAVSMEGGGMRGAVSAGMASALAALGLCDTIDVYYGSSAGSVIGAYMVSRQMVGMDIYVDILPAAARSFVCKQRMIHSLLATAVHGVLRRAGVPPSWLMPGHDFHVAPGMNISFVLDGIMHEQHGVRPLDLETFAANNEKQPLRVASSYVQNGVLHTRSFGTNDFFPKSKNGDDDDTNERKLDRKVLFDCLRASMTVPGATGPPVQMKHSNNDDDDTEEWAQFFDAFCFEPIPFRSAVQEGATHCLVFCSRPEDFIPKSKPTAYETAIAPLYFESHGEPTVAQFFKNGGQQYIYAEDLMTLEQGKHAGLEGKPVKVPPSTVLYGVERDAEREELARNRDETWNAAHLLPLKVPRGTPELATLEQDRDTVLRGVRGGFAAAYDLLAPAIGLDLEMSGHEVAKLLFPDDVCLPNATAVLEERLHVQGERIKDPHQQHQQRASIVDEQDGSDMKRPTSFSQAIESLRSKDKNQAATSSSSSIDGDRVGGELASTNHQQVSPPSSPALLDEKTMADEEQFREILLEKLPGFRAGRMSYLAESLRGNTNDDDDNNNNEPIATAGREENQHAADDSTTSSSVVAA